MADFERPDGLSEQRDHATATVQRRVDLKVPTPQVLPAFTNPSAFHTATALQRQLAGPVLAAAQVQRQVAAEVQAERVALQRQATEAQASLPSGAEQAAVRRQAAQRAEPAVPAAFAAPAPGRPRPVPNAADHVGLYRYEAHALQRSSPSGFVPQGRWQAVQRRVADGLARTYLGSGGEPAARQQAFGMQLATLQRLPNAAALPSVVLGRLPAAERPALQRAMGQAQEVFQRQAEQDAQVAEVQALQRKLAESQTGGVEQQVMRRIRERQGGGTPLPDDVRRRLEVGLNTTFGKVDLGGVRIHADDAADRAARDLHAQAFTSGWDVFFRKGLYNPYTRQGFALLAHEVTHTVQQARGQVGPGVDPDAGLEAQAQAVGEQLGQQPVGGAPKRALAKSSATMTGAQTIQASREATIQRKRTLSKLEQQAANALNSPPGQGYQAAVERGDFGSAAAFLGQLPQPVQDWVIKNEGNPKYSKPGYLAQFRKFLVFWNSVGQQVGRAATSPQGTAFTDAVQRGDFKAADALLAKFEKPVRDWLLANWGKAEYSKPAYQAQFRQYLAYRRDTGAARPADGAPPSGAPPSSHGYVSFSAERGLRLFSEPKQAGGAGREALPIVAPGAVVQLLSVGSDGGTWYKASTPQGIGYLEGQFIRLLDPGARRLQDAVNDPGATVHHAKGGDTLFGLVQRFYGFAGGAEAFTKRGQDMRYFANVIVSANQGVAFNDNPDLVQKLYGVSVPGGDVLGKELQAGTDYLIPSHGYALSKLKDVPSGSLSAELIKTGERIARFMRDYETVKRLAQQKYVVPALECALTDAPAQLLNGLLDFAVLSAAVLAASTAGGAAIGALAGGVGAAPGAALGFEAGLTVLNWAGIGFLVAFIGQQLMSFGGSLLQALKLTWTANGNPTQLDAAARAVADALQTLISLIIQAVIAYLSKKAFEGIGRTAFGRRIGATAANTPVGQWLMARVRNVSTPKTPKPEPRPNEPVPEPTAPKTPETPTSPSASVVASLRERFGKAAVNALLRRFDGNVVQLAKVLKYFGDSVRVNAALNAAGSAANLSKLVNVAKTLKISPAMLESAVLPKLKALDQLSEAQLAQLIRNLPRAAEFLRALIKNRGHVTENDYPARGLQEVPTAGGQQVIRTSTKHAIVASSKVELEPAFNDPAGFQINKVQVFEQGKTASLGTINVASGIPLNPAYRVKLFGAGREIEWTPSTSPPPGFRLKLADGDMRKRGFAGGHTRDTWNENKRMYGDLINETGQQAISFKLPGSQAPVRLSKLTYEWKGKPVQQPKTIFETAGDVAAFEEHLASQLAAQLPKGQPIPDSVSIGLEVVGKGGKTNVQVQVLLDSKMAPKLVIKTWYVTEGNFSNPALQP